MAGRDLVARLPLHAPLTLVLAIAGLGLLRVLTANWREGAVLLGGSLLVAAVLRMVLPVDRVGLLAIRSRVVDALCYSGFGVVMVALAVTITSNTFSYG